MTAQGREPQLSPCGNWKVKDEPFYFWADRPIEPPIKVKFYPVVQAMSVLPDFRNYYGQLELSSYHAQLRVVVDGEEICGHRNLINGGPEKAPAYQIDDALYFKFCSLEEGWQRFNESAVGDQLQLCITIYFLGKPIAQCFTRKAQVYKPCEETPDEQQHRDNLELQSLKAEMREVDIRAVTPWSLQTFFSGPGPAISTTPLPKGLSFLRQEEAEYILQKGSLDRKEVVWSGKFNELSCQYPPPDWHRFKAEDHVQIAELLPEELKSRQLPAPTSLLIVKRHIDEIPAVAQVTIIVTE